MQSYSVQIYSRSLKALQKLPANIRHRIKKAIDGLHEVPRPSGCRKIAGSDSLYRIRIGDYRVLYSIDEVDRIIIVKIIGKRSDVYKDI